jgi:hypothetical protein
VSSKLRQTNEYASSGIAMDFRLRWGAGTTRAQLLKSIKHQLLTVKDTY